MVLLLWILFVVCVLCLSCLFIAALWFLIVSIPDVCLLSYFEVFQFSVFENMSMIDDIAPLNGLQILICL